MLKLESFLAATDTERRQRIVQQLVNSNSLTQFNLVGLDFGNIENVIDNAGQLVSATLALLKKSRRFSSSGSCAATWIMPNIPISAQFMAHVGQKL